ncbi:hypothetical protein SLE2022_096270 [Rubroshorea leprosula]
MILGKVQDFPKGLERENRIIQTIMRQLLFALDGLHSTGIVHRDIKPQNIIFSEGSSTFKIIDLGAAADLRVGINYIPKEFLLDPRHSHLYGQTRMGTSNINGSIQSNKARQRVSAKAALAHPYFDREGLLALSFMQNLRLHIFRATQQDNGEAAKWAIQLMAKSGTEKDGGFTEAQLQELSEMEPKKKANPQRNALASALRLQRKIVRTLNESMDELSRRGKSLWWRRWIPRE